MPPPSGPEPPPPPSESNPAAPPQSRPPWAGPGARKLGRYWIGPPLGKGGMGEVFEAWDTLLDRRVALKFLTFPNAAAILRFLHEAQLQARVTHPNVCRIYDVDASGEVPFIAMQLVQGPNLLQAAPTLELKQAVEILHAVALAINAAHRLNLIHRDLKPSNILLEPDGMGGVNTYVADFGLAKDLAAAGLTLTDAPMGTPEYMPPEQQQVDTRAVGPTLDVYALGVTLQVVFDLCKGRTGATRARTGRPWSGGQGVQASSGSGRGLPRKLRIIIARCLEPRPQDRYPSAGELAEDLRRYLDGEPLLADRGIWLRELQRRIRKHPALAGSLIMGLLLGAGFGLGLARLGARNQRRTAMAQRFILDARDLEHRLRIERLIPVHDLRPTVAHAREGLERIRKEVAALRPEARGPGNLALGKGFAALGEPAQALGFLEAAWNGGCATPETAYALLRVHCELARHRAETWQTFDPQASAAIRTRHLEAARSCLRLAAGAAGEPLELGEAGLLVQEGEYASGLVKARNVFKESPWRYEAKLEEARALEGLGRERLALGDFRAAGSLFQEASLAAQVAQGIGQSDEACCLAELDCRLQRLAQPGLSLAAALAIWDDAGRCADRASAIRPDSPETFAARTFVLVGRAAALAAAWRDPEPGLRRAERCLDPAGPVPALEPLVRQRRLWIQAIRTRMQAFY